MTMATFKSIAYAAFLSLCLQTGTNAFVPASTMKTRSDELLSLHAYVPNGLSAEEYARIKATDKKKLGKDLGRLGPRGFKSRSMQAWQEAYERGETGHAIAPFGYKEKLKKGELKEEDVPVSTVDVRRALKLLHLIPRDFDSHICSYFI